MLSIQECRSYLLTDESQSLSDSEVEAIRDDLYSLARLALASSSLNEYGNERLDKTA